MARYGAIYRVSNDPHLKEGYSLMLYEANSFTDAIAEAYNKRPVDNIQLIMCDLEKYARRAWNKMCEMESYNF